jgi:hypothetical protein
VTAQLLVLAFTAIVFAPSAHADADSDVATTYIDGDARDVSYMKAHGGQLLVFSANVPNALACAGLDGLDEEGFSDKGSPASACSARRVFLWCVRLAVEIPLRFRDAWPGALRIATADV